MEINSKASRRQKAREFHYYAKDILLGDSDFHSGTPFVFSRAPVTAGLRVCSVKFDCGMHNGRLLKKLTPAILPQLVPWECKTPPVVYPEGRYVVMEAAWPKGYARDDIRLDEISNNRSHKHLTVGLNSYGTAITLPAHEFRHLLVAGTTGAGKSWLMRSLARQLFYPPKAKGEPANLVILLDGKGGDGMAIMSGISPNQVGPLAMEEQDVINALGWALEEMGRRQTIVRNNGGRKLNGEYPHIFVVFDEPQVYTKNKRSPIIVAQLNALATQGRAYHIHIVIGTQKPLVENWGDSTTPDMFEASVGGYVKSWQASFAVTQRKFPDLRTLQGVGDMYVVTSAPMRTERVQATYIPEDQLTRLRGCQPMMAEWPEFDTSDYNGKKGGRPVKIATPKELGIGIEAVLRGKGREWLRGQFNNGDTPGASRADKLLDRCEKVVSVLTRRGTKCLVGREHNREMV